MFIFFLEEAIIYNLSFHCELIEFIDCCPYAYGFKKKTSLLFILVLKCLIDHHCLKYLSTYFAGCRLQYMLTGLGLTLVLSLGQI